MSIFSFGKEEDTVCKDLTIKQRVIGWIACAAIGTGMSLILTFVFIFTSFNIAAYAIMYSIAQVVNICGSCFLSTPKGHCKSMWKKDRIIPSSVYLILIILTLVIAIATELKALVLVLLILQMIAYYWYTISFLPFGQKILKKICKCLIE